MRFACRLALLVLVLGLSFSIPAVAAPIQIGGQVSVDGKPAEGVTVTLLPVLDGHAAGVLRLAGRAEPEPAAETSSDATGRFELAAPAIGFWKLLFELDGWVPREVGLEPLLHATELGEVELESDAGIRVRARAGGEPAAARVAAYPFDPKMSRMVGRRVPAGTSGNRRRPLFAGTAGDDGAVRVPASGEEKAWAVEAVAEGFVPQLREVSGRSAEIVLETGVDREVEVLDSGGEPVAGALLFLEDGQLPLAATGERGRAALVAPAGADLELEAIDGQGRFGALALTPPPPGEAAGGPVALVLEDRRSMGGRVVEEGTREPIPGALVWAGSGAEATPTDTSGGYSLRLPGAAGPWGQFVQAAAAGYVPGGERAAAGDAGPTIALEPAASLAGRVVDADGAALAGVEIEASPRADGGRRRFFRPPGRTPRARSAGDGRFAVRGLASGRGYDLRLVKIGFAPAKLETEALEPFEQRSGLEAVLYRGRRAVGLVVDEEELPVAGALVRLVAPSDPRRRFVRQPGAEETVPEGSTGVDGSFAISDLAAGRYELEVSSPGFGPVAVPGVEVSEGAGDFDLGTVVLSPGEAIEGVVVDAGGRPLPGVEIHVAEPSPVPLPASLLLMRLAGDAPAAITAGDGRFVVADRRPGERLDLVVAGEDYVARIVAGIVAPPEEPLRVVLQQASRVSGRVVDERGEPVAGARVQARPEGLAGSGGGRMPSFNRVRSAADGGFELLDVEPGKVTLAAEAEGFQETRLSGLEAPAGGELSDVELVLRSGAVVRGAVLDAAGAPVAGARVRIAATGGAGRSGGFTVADGDGRFELSSVGLGRWTLTARVEDGRQASKSVDVIAGVQTVELRFAGGAEVSGRILGADGTGLAGARVLLDANPRGGYRSLVSETTSGAGGGFVFKDVAAGSYRLMAFKEGYADHQRLTPVEVGTGPVEGLEILMGQGGTVRGRILGLEFDDLAKVEVRAGGQSGKVDFEGGYTVEKLPLGEVMVMAEIPGSGRQVMKLVLLEEEAGEAILDLEFGSGYTLTGIVVTGDEPVAGAAVHLSGATVRASGRGATDARGRFRIEGLEAGGYQLWVRSYDTGVEHRDNLDLLGDDDVRIQIGTGRVAGQVRDHESGDGVEGVTLTLAGGDGAGSVRGHGGKSATSDSRGHFSFAVVPAGPWRLRASKAGYADAEILLQTLAGEVVEDLDVLLAATPGLSFEVVSAIGAPPSRVQVALLDGAGQRVAGGAFRTLEGGRVEITTVPAGSWEMLIAAGDSATLSLPVTVPGEIGRIQLLPGGGVVVEVPELAGGLAGARLQLLGPDGRPHRGISYGGDVAVHHALRGGIVKVTNVTPGPWTAQVQSGERTWSATVVVVPGEPMPVMLR